MSEKEFRLKKSKTFCLMPWLHLHAWPSGSAYPCCLSKPELKFGNTNTQSIDEIINSSEFKNLRKNMMADKPSAACSRCYELESSADVYTLRKNSLESFKHRYDECLENTDTDGNIKDFKMSYMDIRFSNVCNFKCRTCGPEFSSAWQEENKQTYPLTLLKNEKFWPELEAQLKNVEEVYFAGGEALVSPEHYKILKYWIDNKKTDVRLRYTTNFSHFQYKSENLLDLWKHFSDVRVAASLDAEGARAEYLRKGTDWQQIEKNRKQMISRCPHIYFEITPTVSLFNCFNFIDLHRDWIEKGYISADRIRINYLLDPIFMRVQVLPKKLKEKLKEKIKIHLAFLETLEKQTGTSLQSTKAQFQEVAHFVDKEDLSHKLPEFLDFNRILDEKRKEDFLSVFTELMEIVEPKEHRAR